MRTQRFAFLAVFFFSGCWYVEGNGTRREEGRSGADFSAVYNDGSLDVLVERGDTFAITVSIDENLLDHVDTHVSGGTLYISSHGVLRHVVSGPHVRVTLPHLLSARVSGSGRTDAMSFVETAPVDLRVSGSGQLDFEGSAPQLTASVSGSGDLTLQGSAQRLDATVSGSGTLDARQVSASSAGLEASGSGDLTATVNGPVDVRVSGSGDIDVFGAAVVASSHVRGSGDFRLHP